jgi:hypothetical protein
MGVARRIEISMPKALDGGAFLANFASVQAKHSSFLSSRRVAEIFRPVLKIKSDEFKPVSVRPQVAEHIPSAIWVT